MTGHQYPLTIWNIPAADVSAHQEDHSFSLPGADELIAFAELWEESPSLDRIPEADSAVPNEKEEESLRTGIRTSAMEAQPFPGNEPDSAQNDSAPADAAVYNHISGKCSESETLPFATPASIPDRDMPVTLMLQLPKSDVSDPRYLLTVPPLLGQGSLALGKHVLLTFNSFPGAEQGQRISREKTIEITGLMEDAELSLTFDEPRPAAICGLFSLRTARRAVLSLRHAWRMDADVLMTFEIDSSRPGRFTLSLDDPGVADNACHTTVTVGTETALVPLQFPLPRNPGFLRCVLREELDSGTPGELCDTILFPLGRMPLAPRAALPVPDEDTAVFPDDFAQELEQMGVHAIYTQSPLSSACLNALQMRSILACYPQSLMEQVPPELCLHPAVVFMPELSQMHSGAASAWQFCGLLSQPRPLPPDLSAADLLRELFGAPLEPDAPGLPAFLSFLHLLYVRLHAESVRQGTGSGALCAAAEWDDPNVQQCLSQVNAPCHLSICPLRGAWYAGSAFIASVRLFIPPEDIRPLDLSISLTDASGHVLLQRSLSGTGKEIGPFSLQMGLPEQTSILTLTGEIYSGDICLESLSIPVFVGKRGPLEAALTLPGLPGYTGILMDSEKQI